VRLPGALSVLAVGVQKNSELRGPGLVWGREGHRQFAIADDTAGDPGLGRPSPLLMKGLYPLTICCRRDPVDVCCAEVWVLLVGHAAAVCAMLCLGMVNRMRLGLGMHAY
jgi:hypothetical protein